MLIETVHEIEAPADRVWQVFGEGFGEIADWARVILASSLDGPLQEGAVRTCQLREGPLTEELTHFDREKRALTYVVRSGLPGMMKSAENTWTVEALEVDRTRVTSRITAELAWWAWPMTPIVKSQFGKTMQGLMGQLAEASLDDEDDETEVTE